MNDLNKIVAGSLSIAQSKAIELRNLELHPLHLLNGLIENPSTFSSKQLNHLTNRIEDLLSKLPTSTQAVSMEQIKPSGQLTSWLTQASAYATKQGQNELAEKHLLRFMPSIFPQLEIDYSEFNFENEESEIPEFLVDLNEKAQSGKLDPVIGRKSEIRAVMEILGRRGKNNPVLVGSAGVGKTAIAEGLAEAIVRGDVPDTLKGKTLYSLELGSLVAGTKYRGDFEKRIQSLLKFAESKSGEAIFFIDEIHQLIGVGKTDGAMDAANLLKPALSRGELHCIGATTDDEFQKHIMNDPALERRFRKVPVFEPSKEDSLEILMGVKEKFEAHHGIKISDEAIHAAVFLSDQYITDKNLPDKAIDLIDEGLASLKLSAEAMPVELVKLQSEIRNKKILAEFEDSDDLAKELNELQNRFDNSYANWEKEVSSLKQSSDLRAKLDEYKFQLDIAQRDQSYEEASRLKYSLIPELEEQIASFQSNWELKKIDIAKTISRQIGVPVEKILKTKQESLLGLEEKIEERVFGQNESIKELSEVLLTSFAGLKDESRPLGSFLLRGPTGVGKTETAKALAENLFDSEENIIRLDMSEFSEKHSVAKLIGSPAGYVGYEDGGVLTEAIRRKPYAVILFDEIEKAHSDFSDILLQILDDGRLTDNKGRVVNFKNTIILLTTNSQNIEADFKPEVIGRLDSVLDYKALDRSVMTSLVDKQVKLLNERLKANKSEAKFSIEAIKHIAELGYSETYGARPLQAVFDRLVIRPLSKLILKGELDREFLIDLNQDKEIVVS